MLSSQCKYDVNNKLLEIFEKKDWIYAMNVKKKFL